MQAQELKRKMFLGVITNTENNFVIIDSVINPSTAYAIGLKKHDAIVSINNSNVSSVENMLNAIQDAREGDELEVKVKRDNQIISKKGNAIGKPFVKASWAIVKYGWLMTPTCSSRTIIYEPLQKKNKYPAVFFIPGYNCGSIENFVQNYNGKLIEQWVKAGYMVYTIEKSGNGDSYNCKACLEVDLQNDINLYEQAYHQFAHLENVDPQNLFIWGHSMGGIIAPVIKQSIPAKGIMVFGTVFRPWSEFLLEMHRVQKPLLDSLSFEQTEEFVRTIQKVYYEFFVFKQTPQQLYQIPAYKSIVERELEYKEGNDVMWGRHWRFWQQIDSLNLGKAWQETTCNVLALQGTSDYIQCSTVEPYLIKEAVNLKHPHHATLKMLQGVDHLMCNSKDYYEAVKNYYEKAYMKNNFYQPIADETITWMNALKN